MRKKLIWVIGLILVFAVICSCIIYKTIEKQRQQDKYNNAFIELFVTERNEVFLLYETIGLTIEKPTQENYNKALDVAIKTENVCCETYGKLSDIAPTYGAGLVYYATFYRDIKTLLSSSCDIKELNDIYIVLEEIISLYDAHSNPVDSTGKFKAISQFYKSLTLLNEKMNLCEITVN